MIFSVFSLILALFFLSIPVAASIFFAGLMLSYFYTPIPIYRALGEIAWSASSDALLTSIPLFILMGEFLLRAGIATRMYAAINHWIGWLPGGLLHSNIGASSVFAATSGSSVATAATVSTVALPQMEIYGYNPRLFMGSIAAGGTLGILIPPSINLIVYGALTETSIPKLYLAGYIPGFILATSFSLLIIIICVFLPHLAGRQEDSSWHEKIHSLPALVPPLLIFFIVIGSIYAGVATPTEAASLGVVSVLILTAANRKLTISVILKSVEGTVKTTAMIMLIVIAASFLNFAMTMVGFSQMLSNAAANSGFSPYQTLFLIILFYLILGCFMESMAMMITTIPIVTPIVVQMGFDPIWFGIVVILLVETALITPPVGVNLYIVHGVRGQGPLHDVMIGAAPFVIALAVVLGLIIAFPEIVLWLPKFMAN